MSKGDGLSVGNRMKGYESCSEILLPKRIPVILRIDGRAFHTITRKRFGRKWSMEFVEQMAEVDGKNVCFDSRAFSIPQDDVCNYFLWRQIDATRNSIQMAGREYFSSSQLFKKSCNEIQEMLFKDHNINFNDYPVVRKRGFCIVDKTVDYLIPIFSQDRYYIEKHVFIRED